MMKKLCSFLLIIAIMTSFAVPIYAEAEPCFELTSTNGEVGETVEMKLNINNNPGITALSVSVEYSAKDLELLSVESAGLFPDEISTGVEGADPMKVSWYSAGSEDKTDSGTFAILSFKIKENAESSDVTLTYNPENVFNHSLVNQTFAVTNGRVYVGEMPTETTTATPTETTEQTDPTGTEVTEPTTETPTETKYPVTEEPTETTEPTTEKPTETVTEKPTEATEPTTETVTQPLTDAPEPTTKATETTIPVVDPTEPVTNKPTEASTTEPTTSITTDAPKTTTAPVEIRTFNFLPDTEQAKSADSFKLVIQDTKNNLHTYNFLTTENLIYGAVVQTVNVPLNYDIAQVQYQMYQGETWIGQIVKSAAEISAIGENVVRADGTVINPNEPTATTSESETTSPVTGATEPSTDKPTEDSTADTTLPKNRDFEYEIINGEAVITKYSGSDTELTIPSEIEGYKVTAIAGYAFNGCNNLESVIIPEGVTRIEKNAFCECEKLTSVSTPQSLTDIDSRAFVQTPCYYSKNDAWYINDILMQYNGSGTKYSVESGTRVIANSAFRGGYALSEITLPESVIAIGADAFKDTSINVIHANSGSYAEQYASEHSIKLDDLDVTPTEPTTVVTEPITSPEPQTEATLPTDTEIVVNKGLKQDISLALNREWTPSVKSNNPDIATVTIGGSSRISLGYYVSVSYSFTIIGVEEGSTVVEVSGSGGIYRIGVTVLPPAELEQLGYNGERISISMADENKEYFVKFVAADNGDVSFHATGAAYTSRTVYNEDLSVIVSEDIVGINEDKPLSFKVKKGKTYILGIRIVDGTPPINMSVWSNVNWDTKTTETTTPTETVTHTNDPTQPITDNPTESTTITPTQPATVKPTSSVVKPSSKLKPNPIKVTIKKKTVKLKKLKKKAQTVKAVTIKSAKGKVSCKITKAAKIKKYLKINAKGVITFKAWKKAKKGSYKIKVKITVKGNSKYKPKTIKKTVKISLN